MKQIYKNLHEAIFSERNPKSIVAFSKNNTFHLYDLQLNVKSLSLLLSTQKAKTIGICIEDSFWFTVGFAATLYAGKIPVMLGNITKSTYTDIKNKCDFLLTENDFEDNTLSIDYLNIHILQVTNPLKKENEIPTVNKDAGLTPVLSDGSKIIFYTSGSTGKSKRIESKVLNVQTDVLNLVKANPDLIADENQILLATVLPFHLYGLSFRIFLPLMLGIPFKSELTRHTEDLCDNNENLILISSPAFLKRIDTNLKAPKITACTSAGSAMPSEEAKIFFKWSDCRITEIYGSTETNAIASRKFTGLDNELFSLFEGISLKKKDDGFILYAPALPKKLKLDDNIEFFGDKFKIIGRKDRIVKIEENRVSLTTIEEKCRQYSSHIKDCFALVIDKYSRLHIGLVIAVDKTAPELSDENEKKQSALKIKKYLKDYLPQVAIPRYIRFVENIPVNSMGKKITENIKELFND